MANIFNEYKSICIIGTDSNLKEFISNEFYTQKNSYFFFNNFSFDLNNFKKLCANYDRFFIDDCLLYLNKREKQILFNTLKQKKKKLVYTSSNNEEIMFSDYLIVLNKNKIAIEGPTLSVLKEEKILKRLGIKLPFIIDLSIQLNYYGLIDKLYLNSEELINTLWK